MANQFSRIRIVVIIAVVVGVGWFVPVVRGALVTLFSPLIMYTRQSSSKIVNNVHLIQSIPVLFEENTRLATVNVELQAKIISQAELEHENRVLRQELQFLDQLPDQSLLAAQVISRTSSVVGQTLIINKGSQDGFNPGMAIVAHGYLVGRVASATPNTSVVELIMSHRSLIPVVLQQSRTVGLLRGGVEGLILEDIPRDVVVSRDEPVVTAAIGEVIKSGIPVGKIVSVGSSQSDVFQSARIESPINFRQLEIVFGLKS